MDAAAGPLVLARHNLDRGRPDRALDALANVASGDVQTREFWALRSRALYQLRRWAEAVTAARTGLELAPEDFQLLDVLALAQLESGKKRRARKTIEHALELYPDQPVLHAHRALILARSAGGSFRLARYGKARAAVGEALRLDPQCEAALRVRAQIAMLSRDRRAAEYSAELLSIDPEDEQAHVIAGSTLARRGDIAAGLEHYLEAARLDPSNRRLAWMGRRSRILQGRFFAPMIVAHRLARGRLRFAWVLVALAALQLHQPIVTAAVFAFWVYMWAVYLYVRLRIGKAPK
jgi:tetratricopeptide (TPR) repeat protein